MLALPFSLVFPLFRPRTKAATIAKRPTRLPTTAPAITPALVPRGALSLPDDIFSGLGIPLGGLDKLWSEVVMLFEIAVDSAPESDVVVDDDEEGSIVLDTANIMLRYPHE